ncbi:1-aminocyclopropane-1-carboxylate synthase [Chlorella sorokiniana]|uniref:1-aminocyclopropane-1-carboxylate synthase n=1 Tax=Chlorella sorokiniana TaxID=3076 RepID=A0A2P6TZI2_CHLSO|nr:1-aminocyclopropane-1-carboxylate synthase [Chlorella sorokiniana]|eukprot:PRW59463.1 1-aminocyclopropane-1-carboxylate synthase [Chlorella sorokiniana]
MTSAAASADERRGCSARSGRLLKPALSYIGRFLTAMQEGLWDPKTNPDGWIPLVVAENKLNNAEVLARLQEGSKDAPEWVMNYGSMRGVPQLQAAMARLLERFLLPGFTVDPSKLCISAGCTAIIDNLIYALCDEGDGVLIPAPYYPAFDNDLQAKCCVHPLPFYLSEEAAADGLPIRQQLDAAVEDARGFGVPVKALLITNPNNPLGTIYSDETIKEAIAWCLDNRVHYISDEVYALSVFKEHARFTSALLLAQQLVGTPSAAAASNSNDGPADGAADGSEVGASTSPAAVAAAEADGDAAAASVAGLSLADGSNSTSTSGGGSGGGSYTQRQVNDYVHMVYGLSKDWCASGLRVGMLYSRNTRLQKALDNISAFSTISNFLQWGLIQMLSDHEWAAGFLQRNQRSLEASYDALAGALEAEGIPFTPAVSGMFVWVDLRRWLAEPTWEAEEEFWRNVCDRCKVILTPGKDCHAAEPGFFRLCFAWMPPKALPEAVRRIKLLMGSGASGAGSSECSVQ